MLERAREYVEKQECLYIIVEDSVAIPQGPINRNSI